MTDEELEMYAEEYHDLPAYSRKKNHFTFNSYVIDREAGFLYDDIKSWIIKRGRK